MKLVIIGGVAGGASAAARARRLDEKAEIVMFERGEFISFANCGLPYHVGEVIAERSSLLVMTPEMFKARTNIEARVMQEVVAIDRQAETVTVHDLRTGEHRQESYDKLILATGSSPVRPPLPGLDDPDVLQLWTIPDMDRIKSRVDEGARRAVVVGGGFIGLEIAENLRERGVQVDLVEMLPQVLPTLDAEMSQPLADELVHHGVNLHLGRRVVAIERPQVDQAVDRELHLKLDDGSTLTADFAVLSVGVRPNSELAAEAGLELTERKGVVVDDHMRTSDPDIYAVGDVVACTDLVTGKPAQIPLAGPANKQGRVAAENACGRDRVYRGTLGTSVVKLFNVNAGSAGHTERRLKESTKAYRKIYLHPASHASYYPGASPLAMKLLFSDDGTILGVQIVGAEGVDKRLDVIATAMRAGLKVTDLADLELAYAPPFGSAKDPVNFAGMLAGNVLNGDSDEVSCEAIPDNALLLDVREPAEYELGHIQGAAFIPLGQLRHRLDELPRDRKIVAYCKVGLRGYLAERILKQNGFDAANLTGGWLTWKMFNPATAVPIEAAPSPEAPEAAPAEMAVARQIDVTALQCPGPIVRVRQELEQMNPGQILELKAPRSFRSDLGAWVGNSGNELVQIGDQGAFLTARIRKGTATVPAASCGMAGPAAGSPDKAAIVLFSGDLDKAMAAFIIAIGMAAQGTKVDMFFTFWGLNVLRRDTAPPVQKDLLSRMFGWMMPRGARKLALSKMHMMGMGTGMMKYVMAKKNVASLPELIREARELGVRFVACEMAMNVMGLQREELLESVDDIAGVASFAGMAKSSGTTLFI